MVFRHGGKRRILPSNPVAFSDPMTSTAPEQQCHTINHLRALLAVDHPLSAMVSLFWLNGLRASEVCTLTWADSDERHSIIHIQGQLSERDADHGYPSTICGTPPQHFTLSPAGLQSHRLTNARPFSIRITTDIYG